MSIKKDGTGDFSGGVDCTKVTTLASVGNPNGLPRNSLAWMTNGTTRGGGLTSRYGWKELVPNVTQGLYQGGYMYEPFGANPYLILAIGGELFMVLLEGTYDVVNLSTVFGLTNPATEPFNCFTQAEEFLVNQIGDGVTLPLFWDGNTLRRSNGLTGATKEIPAASVMTYYSGRLWYARDRIYTAGDIVRGPSGTAPYGRRDSVLKVTENPLAFGGDGFSVPTQAGSIRALFYPANIDTNLGQGPLLIGTRKSVYAMTVPVSRSSWTSSGDNQPLQVVAQHKWGPVGDRSVVIVNSDNFYQTLEPGIRSLIFARRNQGQWANTSISANVNRIVRRNDRGLLRYSSGINWDNRLWQTALPEQTTYGVIHKALVSLDFDPLSTMQSQLPPVWEGHSEGLQVLQLFESDFGGLQRAFAVILTEFNTIAVWELTRGDMAENGDNRITWSFESPAWTWADTIGENEYKTLLNGEISFDQVWGKIDVTVEFRPDYYPCWQLWTKFEACIARSTAEDPYTPSYPPADYLPGYHPHKNFGKPPDTCLAPLQQPANLGFQFQVRVTIKGWAKVRSLHLFAERAERPTYYNMPC